MRGPFVFLDIDGVLNKHQRHQNKYSGLDSSCVECFNQLLEATHANVVLTSAWRYFVLRGEMNIAGINGCLATHGLKFGCVVDVVGPDQTVVNADRGLLVREWLRTKYGVAHDVKLLCIDDMDLGYTEHRLPLLLTKPDAGLAGVPVKDFEAAARGLV